VKENRLRLKRAYQRPARSDGLRILVDRLWPRGLSKEKAAIGMWMREVAPSDGLRKWFGHDPARWPGFKKRYARELEGRGELLDLIRKKAKEGPVTLVYAAKDTARNNAVIIKAYLEDKG
jgi:uncharacterized protein YeaO (DUF488 family)